jgi:small-conductance mechanosensitive channel
MSDFQTSNEKAKKYGSFLGNFFHLLSKNFFKVVVVGLILLIISAIFLVGWFLLTCVIGKDGFVIKRINAYLVKKRLKKLKYGDIITTIFDIDEKRVIGRHRDKIIEDFKGGNIVTYFQEEPTRFAGMIKLTEIYTHERAKI